MLNNPPRGETAAEWGEKLPWRQDEREAARAEGSVKVKLTFVGRGESWFYAERAVLCVPGIPPLHVHDSQWITH